MSTHINGIAQATRRVLAIEAQLHRVADRHARTALGRDLTAVRSIRHGLVLAAMRDGVEGDLISWAIQMQEPSERAVLGELIEQVAESLAAEEMSGGS